MSENHPVEATSSTVQESNPEIHIQEVIADPIDANIVEEASSVQSLNTVQTSSENLTIATVQQGLSASNEKNQERSSNDNQNKLYRSLSGSR